VLVLLGVPEERLVNQHGPCPICGGKDRFRFDNRKGHGDFYCNGCRPGDGFQLLMRLHRWKFSDAMKRVMEVAGLRDREPVPIPQPVQSEPEIARPTERVKAILRESCAIEDCAPVVAYLRSRYLWPLPIRHTLRAHPSVEYWHQGHSIGRYPALVAAVKDVHGDLVTAHVTYIEGGQKLSGFEPRKLLSPLTGRVGPAVQLMAPGKVLGIAEGIETALSAHNLQQLPVWAALNTSLLAKFEPPAGVEKLVIYADRDVGGMDAATKLMERLQGRVNMEVRAPTNAKDWNDVLRAQRE